MASEIGAASLTQFLLKFIVAHPAVTCVIPATGQVAHVVENIAAADPGPFPTRPMRRRMVAPRRGPLMSEWWSYTFSDFLLFSPRTYYRLIKASAQPGGLSQVHMVTIGLGLVISDRGCRAGRRHGDRHASISAIPGHSVELGGVGVRLEALRHHQLGRELPGLAVRHRGAGPGVDRGRPRTPQIRFKTRVDPAGILGMVLPVILSLLLPYPTFAPPPGPRLAAGGGLRGRPRIRR